MCDDLFGFLYVGVGILNSDFYDGTGESGKVEGGKMFSYLLGRVDIMVSKFFEACEIYSVEHARIQ